MTARAQTPNLEKPATPAPGAESAAENTAQGAIFDESQKLKFNEAAAATPPEWLAGLLESNSKVIASNEALIASNDRAFESNEAVVEAIDLFRESARDLVKEVLNSAKNGSEAVGQVEKPVLEVDPEARYIVAKGKSFRGEDFSVEYVSGTDVTHFSTEALKSLLNRELIEEA